jgi:hypothetical protein
MRSPVVKLDTPVPPLPTPRIPVISVPKFMSEVETAPAAALRKPDNDPRLKPPVVVVAVTDSVPVAAILAPVILPVNKPLPATERAFKGEVVPIPTFPAKVDIAVVEDWVIPSPKVTPVAPL